MNQSKLDCVDLFICIKILMYKNRTTHFGECLLVLSVFKCWHLPVYLSVVLKISISILPKIYYERKIANDHDFKRRKKNRPKSIQSIFSSKIKFSVNFFQPFFCVHKSLCTYSYLETQIIFHFIIFSLTFDSNTCLFSSIQIFY